jgi:hypothetical protein
MMRNFSNMFLRARRALEFSHGLGQTEKCSPSDVFRFSPVSGHHRAVSALPSRAKTGREQMQQNRMRHLKIAVLQGSLHTGGCHIPSPAGMMEGAVVFGQ